MGNIGSTFGIDIRRKIWAGDLRSDAKDSRSDAKDSRSDAKDLRSDWLKGEIDPSCLKNIAWTFEEVLTSATNQYGEAYDELTAGLREALKSFTKLLRGVSLGKDVNSTSAESGESKSTQSALMEAAGAISAFTGSPVSEDLLKEAFLIAPKYNIPARSAVPKVQIPISTGGLKVCFSYGKAGLFNAKEEVWDPIRNIMASLSPGIEDSKYGGLLAIGDGTTIPFEFQSKYYFIKSAAMALKDEISSSNITIKGAVDEFVKATKSITTTAKKAAAVQVKIDKELKRQSDAYEKVDENIAELYEKGDDNGLTADLIFTGKRAPNSFKGGQSLVSGHPMIRGQLKAALKAYSSAEEKLSGYKLQGDGKYSDVPLSQKDEVGDKYTDKSLYHEKAEILDEVAKSSGDITSVLTAIATIRPRLVGQATVDQYNAITGSIKTFNMMLSGGDGNVFFNIDDIENKIDDGTLHSLLSIRGIPTKVEASFDYSSVDENGYPMSGTIEIKSIWSVETYGKAVTLRG